MSQAYRCNLEYAILITQLQIRITTYKCLVTREDTMLVTLIILLLHDAVYATERSDCFTGEKGTVQIANVTTAIVLSMSDEPGLSTALIMEYSWDVVNTDEIRYDGFLYKLDPMMDASSLSFLLSSDDYESSRDTSCNITSQKELWSIAGNGTAVRCEMPCSTYFPNVSSHCFESESVCSLRNQNAFHPLPADARNVSIAASFGEEYVFRLYIYQHWMVVDRYDEKEITIFCQDELVEKRGFNISEAKYRCRNVSMANYPSRISGPPASFENYSVSYDLTLNRGQITFRWKEPYDVSPTSTPISKYTVWVRQGEYQQGLISSDDRREDSYFYVTITMIQIGEENNIKVTPFNKDSELGVAYETDFIIPEINACLHPNRYCAIHARCVDLLGSNETAATCNCTLGYEGNGINPSFGGEGCLSFDACRSLNVCAENAECVDEQPPSMEATCTCRPGYFGDGTPSGYGCRRISSVVLLASVVPMGLLSFFSVYICLKRLRRMKERSQKLSKFFASSNAKYMAPLQYFNGFTANSAAVFGQKYELDRNKVDVIGVLGRGNFGVVYSGTLKTESGKLQVAIKTTAEPHSHEMEMEFLAEIALLLSIGQHKNILNIIGCCTSGTTPVYLVTPLMKFGDLLHFLWDCREESNRTRDQIYILKEGNIYNIAKQVANGLEYVTGLRIIHGDIAARNILVDENLKCKISDFGLANDVYLYGAVKGAREKRVPIRWISPERMQEGRVPITWRSDVWSFGILLYEMSTLGAAPFADVPASDLFERLKSGFRLSKPKSCSHFLYDIMMKCWEWVPSKRPTFKEIKNTMAEADCIAGHHYENMIQDE